MPWNEVRGPSGDCPDGHLPDALTEKAAAAEKGASLKGRYVLSYDLVYGNHIVASGPGSATVVGDSSMLAYAQIRGDEAVGSATITAANGDLIYIVSLRTEEPGTPAVGPFTVVGGTGRFVNASGPG